MRKTIGILLFTLMIPLAARGQAVTNVEKVYSLIDNSAAQLLKDKVQRESRVYIDYNSSPALAILKNPLIEKAGAYCTVNQQKENAGYILNYTVEDAGVKYGEVFTKSFLGTNYVEREVYLKGFAGLNPAGGGASTAHFEYSSKDTVEYGKLKELAGASLPFANPEIPAEPFFSSILEPVIAIGAAITTIYLLFTVRSK